MTNTSLADLPLPERISKLIATAKRFGPVIPTWGVVQLHEQWLCECGEACGKAGKHPRIRNWNTRATKNEEQIAEWCIKYPRANWGIVAGEVIDVLDLDRKPGGIDGVAMLKSWETTHGAIPGSVRVATGYGKQIYFKPGSGLRTTANDGIGIDVRAAGSGYCMAPGSRHVTGKVYEIILDEGLQECPQWLISELFSNQSDIAEVTICCIHSKGRLEEGGGRKPICRERGRGKG